MYTSKWLGAFHMFGHFMSNGWCGSSDLFYAMCSQTPETQLKLSIIVKSYMGAVLSKSSSTVLPFSLQCSGCPYLMLWPSLPPRRWPSLHHSSPWPPSSISSPPSLAYMPLPSTASLLHHLRGCYPSGYWQTRRLWWVTSSSTLTSPFTIHTYVHIHFNCLVLIWPWCLLRMACLQDQNLSNMINIRISCRWVLNHENMASVYGACVHVWPV